MGVFRQLGALFWKNFIIRKRNPMFLVLEILWPVALFAALALMRLGFQPDHRETCEYPERALPSAGLIPFLQSSICTLNNNCSNREWIEQRAEAQQRFQAMIQDIQPLLNKKTTIDAFKALPTVTFVLTAIKDVANGTTIEDIDDKLLIRNLFRDPDEVVNILSDKYEVLDRRTAEGLMDSSLNAVALIAIVGTVDFKDTVCDPNKLEKFIIFSDKNNKYVVNKYTVSTSLCRIEDDKISDIINELVKQLDIANIVRLAQDLANITGTIDYAWLFEDIADLLDVYTDKSSVFALMGGTIDLNYISVMIRQFGKVVPILNNLADIDFGSLESLLDVASPFVKALTNDTEVIDAMEQALTIASDSLSSLNGTMDLATIMKELPKLMNSTDRIKNLGLPDSLTQFPLTDAKNLFDLLAGNKSLEDSNVSINDTLDYMQGMIESMLGNDTANWILAMATNTLEMMEHVMALYDEMETGLKDVAANTEAVTIALNKLEEAGPEVMNMFMQEMVTMENIYSLMAGLTNTANLCEDAVITAYKLIDSYDHNDVVSSVCSDEATEAVDQVFLSNSLAKITATLAGEMSDMNSMLQGVIPEDQEVRMVKTLFQDVIGLMGEMMADHTSAEEWEAVLANTNMDYMGTYNWVWISIGQQYRVQMTMLPILLVGQSAENSPLWESVFSPEMEMIDAILHSVVHRLQLLEEMNKEDKITTLFEYRPYFEIIVWPAVGLNRSKLTSVLSGNDTIEAARMLCEDIQWESLNVPPGEVSIEEMEQFVCSTNVPKLIEDIGSIFNSTSFASDMESELNSTLDNGIEWKRMASDIQYLQESIYGRNTVLGLIFTVLQSYTTSYYTVMQNSLTNMAMGGIYAGASAGTNATYILTSLEQIDEALVSWDMWKRVKHYIRTWHLFTKVMNEYGEMMQDPDWNITEYIVDMSPTLGKYFTNAMDTMPEVIGGIQTAASQPQQLIERMLSIDFMGFCEGNNSLSTLLGVQPTPAFSQFQDGLCKLNWTQIMYEMERSNSPWNGLMAQWDIISTYNTSSLPPISLDWAAVISSTGKFVENANNGVFNSFMTDLSYYGFDSMNSSMSNLTSALQNTRGLDANQIASAIDQLLNLLFDMSPDNNTFIGMWQYNIAMQSYMNYYFTSFLIKNLEIVNRTQTFNLPALLNSSEADKLLKLVKESAEANLVLLYTIGQLQNDSMEKWLSANFSSLCINTVELEQLIEIPENSTITKAGVVDAVCAAVDFEKLWNELRIGVLGLDEFVTAIENAISMNMTASELLVSASTLYAVNQRYNNLVAALAQGNITVEGLPIPDEAVINQLLEQFTEISTDVQGTFNMSDPLQLLQYTQQQALQYLMMLQAIPEVADILRISEMYMRMLTAIFTETEVVLIEPAGGFMAYPEMDKMWKLINWLPQIYATYTYTSLVDNPKISTLTEALIQGTDVFCQKDPTDLMTNPPILDIQFEQYFTMFCSMNFTLLEEEAMRFIQEKNLTVMDNYAGVANVTDGVDMETWMAEYERLMQAIAQFANNTDQFNIPGFQNMTLWEEIMSFLQNTTMNMDTLQMVTNNMAGLFETLTSISPEFQNQLKTVEVTYYVFEIILDRLDNMTGDPHEIEDFFYGYGEIQHLLALLLEPGVMQTLAASVNTPEFQEMYKNSNVTVVLEDVCSSNITKYMTIPPRVTANMTDVKERFCKLNFTILIQEFFDVVYVEDIMDIISQNTTTNWAELTKQNMEITERLQQLLENPPMIELPLDWQNSTYWFELLELLNGVQAEKDGNASVSTLLEGMENFLGSQYTDLINSLAPIMEMIILDSDAKKTFATIDIFLEYMIERLMEVSDNFTGDTQSKNSSDIIRFLEALSNLKNMSTSEYESLNNTIDKEKLFEIFLDPGMLMAMCDNGTAAKYISANNTANTESIALAEVICIDTATWQQVLQDQIKLSMFEEKLTNIWNSSDAHLNWTSLSSNMKTFIGLLMDWTQASSNASDPLMKWMDWDGIMPFLSSALMDPNVLLRLVNNINPLVGTEMNIMTSVFNHVLIPLFKQLQSGDIEDIFNDPERILSVVESIASAEDWLTILSRVFDSSLSKEAPTREGILDAFVCDVTEFEKYMGYFQGNLTEDKEMLKHLCGANQANWNYSLSMFGFTTSDIAALQELFDLIVYEKMAEYEASENDLPTIQSILDMFEKLNLDGVLSNSTTDDWLQKNQTEGLAELMDVLEMMASEGMLIEFKRILLIVVEVQEYIDMILGQLTGNESIPITDILPSSDAMSRFLQSLAGNESLSSLTMSFVDPAKFISLLFSKDWNTTVCNMTLFLETFSFPEGVNVTSLQHDLCTEYASRQPYLDDIMNAVDIGKLIQKIEDILMNDTVVVNNETFAYMSNLVERITDRLFDLGNVNITGWGGWIESVLGSFQPYTNNTQEQSSEESCDRISEYFSAMPMYTDWVKPYIDSYHSFVLISFSMLNVQIGIDKAICDSDTSNITKIMKHIEELGVLQEIEKIRQLMSGEMKPEFSCNSYPTYMEFADTYTNAMMKLLNGSSNWVECMTDTINDSEELRNDIAKLFSAGSDVLVLLQDEELQKLLSDLLGTNVSSAMIETVLNIYNQQEQAVKQLQENLENNLTDISSFLQDTLSSNINTLLSAVNMSYLQNAENLTIEEIIDKLCSKYDLGMLEPNLNSTLCGEDKALAADVARNLMYYANTLEELQNLAEYDSTAFWKKISTDLSAVIGNIEGLSSLTRLMDGLGAANMSTLAEDRDLLHTIQEVLIDNGPDAILENLNTLLDDFRILDDSNMTNAVLDDIKLIAEGISAFSSLRTVFMANVKVKEFVRDTAYLRDYMINTLELPVNVTDAIIDGSINIEVLLSAAQSDYSDWICNSTQLAEVIEVADETVVNADLLSQQFCDLDTDTMTALLDEIMLQLDIGPLMEELMLNGINGILRDANVSLEDTKHAIEALVESNDDLREITRTFNDFAETIPEAFANLASAQTGDQEFGSLSAMLCGNALPIINDDFITGDVLESQTNLSAKQQNEMEALPSNPCKDMYLKIMKDRNGPIIWTYLKPLLRGKIVYAPDTPEVQTIVGQINTTFSSLEEFIELAVNWAEGSVALGDLTGSNAKELQDLLGSKVIKSMLTEVGGVSSKDLDDIMYTLEDTDMEVMEGISKVAKLLKDYISCVQLDRFVGYSTEAELLKASIPLADKNELLAGLVFDTSGGFEREKRDVSPSISTHVHYKIRMEVDNVPTTDVIKARMWRPQPNDQFFTEMRYFRGFAQLQDMIDRAIIVLHVGPNVTLPTVTTNQFPFPCHTQDVFVNTIAGYLLNVLMTLSWLASISVAVYSFVYDRERGQEETLSVMGMKSGINWLAWFCSTMLVMAIVAGIDVLILRYGNIFVRSNMLVIYVYFIAFIFSTVMLCYLVSAFFTQTSLAILASIIVYVCSYLPFSVLYSLEIKMKFWQKTIFCLSSTAAFSYAAQFIARFEEQQIGLNWDNINEDPLNADGFSFVWCCTMMLIDGVIYLILGWYVRNVKPGKFGISEPWYFIFIPTMWCRRSSGHRDRYAPQNDGVFTEDIKYNTPVVLSARGLSKTYSDGTVAVTNLCLDIHSGHVTTLLGHNGAAKTTTMNMLTGILEPTHGGVRILNQPMKHMKGRIGVCTQHNALYEYMTVKEHMDFYSAMKSGSCNGISAKDEVRQLLKDVDLYSCRNMLVKKLSGGMQRRLCVALAFVGGSKVVILDEPTSGIDPSGRRAVWNLIMHQKSGTGILLSTHHMDEADIISDEIVVMHEGHLLCQGSPMFLKKHLASGHRLTIVQDTLDTDPVSILTLIKRWIPNASLQSSAGAEMTFVLPTMREADFYGLFRELDTQKHALAIANYGISDPKLEEVFLKVCSAADIGRKITPETLTHIEEEETATSKEDWKHDFESSGGSRERLSKTSEGHGGGVMALLTKRFHHYRRNWRIIISTFILPLLLFLIATGLYQVRPDETYAPNLFLSPAMYGPSKYVFMQQNSTTFNLGNDVLNSLMVNPGIGTSCMDGMDLEDPYQCVTPDTSFMTMSQNVSVEGRCYCDNHEYKCEGSPYGAAPEQRVTTTTDMLQDLKSRDINQYLLQSFPEFIEKRYGGWSFEDETEDADTKLKAKIWYNNKGFHALPSFYNAYSNGLLRSLVNDSSQAPKYGISTYNHPFMFGRERLSKFTILQHSADIGIAVMILLAFTFIPVGILIYSVNEYTNKEKHMQFISGIGAGTYWCAAIIWDMLVLCVTIGVSVIILFIFKPESFWLRDNLPATVCLLLLYGWASITFAYLVSKRFATSGTAFFTVFCSLMFTGVLCVLLNFALNYFQAGADRQAMKDVYRILRKLFLIFPPYALSGGMLDLIDNQLRTTIYERFDTDVYVNPFSFDLIAWHLIAMAIEGCVFFVLTLWSDSKCCCSRTYECSVQKSEDDDSDVAAENKRIDSGDCKNDVVVVGNLHKTYHGSKSDVHAINGLSFGVPPGQCFGLLGVNGAGKTSTFDILTGILDASYGRCFILGQRIEPGSSVVGQNIGYCPQHDALDLYLNITDTLRFHANLKGIDGSARKQAVEKVMNKLQLNKIQKKIVKTCSGGMKRKLSLAIALLGDPAVVFLDEPTTGMDPTAKRLAWDCLLDAKRNGQAIILTSHSLEECDILCDRIGIMVNGRFKCLGTSQHLKQKYGDGYTVTLYVSGLSNSMTRIYELIHNYFPTSSISDRHMNVIQLDIPRDSICIADIFGILEREKANFNILYYTVSQTTLDTIFLNFAREQTDGATLDISDEASVDSEQISDGPSTSAAVNNPYYGYTNPTLSSGGDIVKGRPSMAYNTPYMLPSKNTFIESDDGSSSIRL